MYSHHSKRANKENKCTQAMLGTYMTFSCVRNMQNILCYALSSLTQKKMCCPSKKCAGTLVHMVALLQKIYDGILTAFCYDFVIHFWCFLKPNSRCLAPNWQNKTSIDIYDRTWQTSYFVC